MQRTILAEYLAYRDQVHKAKMMEKWGYEIPIIKWGDRRNKVDSGIFLMRHLETFMGDASAKWACGITSTSAKQMATLRVRYCAAMINWEENNSRASVLKNADKRYQEVCADHSIKAETLLLG